RPATPATPSSAASPSSRSTSPSCSSNGPATGAGTATGSASQASPAQRSKRHPTPSERSHTATIRPARTFATRPSNSRKSGSEQSHRATRTIGTGRTLRLRRESATPSTSIGAARPAAARPTSSTTRAPPQCRARPAGHHRAHHLRRPAHDPRPTGARRPHGGRPRRRDRRAHRSRRLPRQRRPARSAAGHPAGGRAPDLPRRDRHRLAPRDGRSAVTVDAANLVLVTPAASLAGPAASVESITARAVDLALLAAPDSPVMATVDRVLAASRFVAVIRGVAVEDSSTRGLVKLETRKGDEVDTETIRTERTDGPEGRAMVDRLRPLIGHRVLVFKEVEDGGRDRKYRLLVHVVDLGHEAGTPAPAPAPPSGPRPAPG